MIDKIKKEVRDARKSMIKVSKKKSFNSQYSMGIDISKRSPGFAIIEILTEKIIFSEKFASSITNNSVLFLDYMIYLNHILKKYKPGIVIIEDFFLHQKKPNAVLSLGIIQGIMLSVLIMEGYDVKKIHNMSIKAYHGCKNKEQLFNFINKKYNLGYCFEKDNDITDAIAIALCHDSAKIKNYWGDKN